MSDSTNERKIEHINIIGNDEGVDRRKFYFDDVVLRHRALPELDLSEVDSSTTFMGKALAFPLLISSMTGGDHEMVRRINQHLAEAAEQEKVALGVGSQRVMFTNPEARSSFEIRRHAPTALLFSNLGAVQLNKGFGLAECKAAVETVGADALYLHLNPLQEAVQPEGDTVFAGLAEKIGEVAAGLELPVVVKEVGAGISEADVKELLPRGITYYDVAGTGGTSWSRIEHHRQERGSGDLGIVFQDWGIPTPLALRALKDYRDRITLIASGGIRSGVDMVKAVVLGASLCGQASPFLEPAKESSEAVARVIRRLKKEFTTGMFLLGVRTVDELKGNDDLLLRS